MKIARLLLTACLAAGVLGCGQKGPLVMPDAPKHKRSIPALPAAPSPAPRSGAASPTPATPPSTPP